MAASLNAHDQIADLMADAMPQQILAFKFSSTIQERIEQLVEKKKDGFISLKEVEELDKYLTYDLLIGLAKARAFKFQSA
jgi:methylase of polypeptide subunit release factors